MKPVKRNNRLLMLGGAGVLLASSTALIMSALNQNISYFYSPIEIQRGEADLTRRIRLGGLVANGTVRRGDDIETFFDVTDGAATISVAYRGILPDLFREGQGVIAHGTIQSDGYFKADTILAKHDENYKPKELEDALEKAGHPKNQEPTSSY